MSGQNLFEELYEPKLIEQGVDNVVLRTYIHAAGSGEADLSNSADLIFTSRKDAANRIERFLASNALPERGIAITSTVSVGEHHRLLFLVDCALPVTHSAESELAAIVRSQQERLPGLRSAMLLRTQHSFHIAGFVPLTAEEWQRHMAEALLLQTADGSPVVDARYVGHSLEYGYGSLRLSAYRGKPLPELVCYL